MPENRTHGRTVTALFTVEFVSSYCLTAVSEHYLQKNSVNFFEYIRFLDSFFHNPEVSYRIASIMLSHTLDFFTPINFFVGAYLFISFCQMMEKLNPEYTMTDELSAFQEKLKLAVSIFLGLGATCYCLAIEGALTPGGYADTDSFDVLSESVIPITTVLFFMYVLLLRWKKAH